jgi:hypothetical protein
MPLVPGGVQSLGKDMRNCALTMVYRDYWAISQWYTHYSRHLGAENLFTIAHGQGDWISELCPRAHVVVAPRDNLARFDQKRGQMLNAVQDELGQIFEWVIRTDADELICLDPSRFESLSEMFKSTTAPAVFAMGLNLAELEKDGELTKARPALMARSDAVLIKANRHRKEVASGPERGLPGDAWKQAGEEAKQFYVETLTRPIANWDRAVEKVHRKIGRRPAGAYFKDGVIKARSLQFPFRIILPAWFKTG